MKIVILTSYSSDITLSENNYADSTLLCLGKKGSKTSTPTLVNNLIEMQAIKIIEKMGNLSGDISTCYKVQT